jgi:hypothetical protein
LQQSVSWIQKNKFMKPTEKKLVKKELEKIYDSGLAASQTGKFLRNKFSQSLKENPRLLLVLKLVIIANIGIWSVLALLVSQIF